MHAPNQTAFEPCELTVRDLRCDRGMRTLFEGVGFTLSGGHALRISGANGAGKTSLLRILATLSQPEAGQLEWNGAAVQGSTDRYLSRLGYVGHKNALKTDLSAVENLRWLTRLNARSSESPDGDEQLVGALEQLGVRPLRHRPIRQLSAGQRQRVALARLWLADVPLWILDEPATALDPEGIERVQLLIKTHLERQGLLVFTSHQALDVDAARLTTLEVSA